MPRAPRAARNEQGVDGSAALGERPVGHHGDARGAQRSRAPRHHLHLVAGRGKARGRAEHLRRTGQVEQLDPWEGNDYDAPHGAMLAAAGPGRKDAYRTIYATLKPGARIADKRER